MVESTTNEPAADFTAAVDEVLRFYNRLDDVAASLPTVSIMPFFKYSWVSFKFTFFLIVDIFLFIPVNAVVLIRNLIPGRWAIWSFSYSYFKAAARWVWNGECWVSLIVIRPLTAYLLHWHFYSRLQKIRRNLTKLTGFSEDVAKAAFAKVDCAINFWRPAGAGVFTLTWLLPALAPAAALWKEVAPPSLSLSLSAI